MQFGTCSHVMRANVREARMIDDQYRRPSVYEDQADEVRNLSIVLTVSSVPRTFACNARDQESVDCTKDGDCRGMTSDLVLESRDEGLAHGLTRESGVSEKSRGFLTRWILTGEMCKG